MSTLRRAWGPNAITRWSLLASLIMVVLVGLPGFAEAPDYGLGERLVIAAASALPALGLLALARLTWLAPGRTRYRAPLSVITFAGAGALAGATRGWLIDAAGITNPIPPGWRIPALTVAGVIWLSAVAVVVDHVRRHRTTMRDLREREAEMLALDHREREELDEVTRHLRTALLEPARRALADITAELAALDQAGQTTNTAARVQAAVEATIRPLSHDILAAEPDAPALPAAPPAADRRERLGRIVAMASRRVPHAPWVVAAIPVVLFPLLGGPRWGLAFLAVNAVVTWVALALMLIALRMLLEPLLVRLATAWAAVALVGGYLVVTAIGVLITMLLDPLSPLAVGYQAIALVTITPILIGASVAEAAVQLNRDDERALRHVIAEIGWSLARVRMRLRHEHHVLGTLLHGRVQGALIGIARSLEDITPETPAAERDAVLAGALARLADVEGLLDSPHTDDQPLEDALGAITALWARVLEISLDLPEGARDAIDADPAARRAVADVVAEGLSNAVRHGAARRAWVTIEADDDVVTVTVTDDGQLGTPGPSGMGSALLDEASPEWSLARDGEHTVLAVRLPLARARVVGAP
ncbi:MAG: hypothetical protein ACO3PB_03960 [Miltoncostaeaceae bacterium]